MSRDINRIMLLGRLGTDPILRATKAGTPVANFSLATETYNKAKNESETTWHRIVTWGKPAERAHEELKKGMSVFLEGAMKVRKYQDDEGELHYIHEIHVDKINFLHRKTKLASGETALETVSNDDAVQDITQ
jgi:single-strand DNA-binding protein